MIHSMTGYGDAECVDAGVSYALEIRSVNNRYFKSLIKLPEALQCFEPEIERLLRERLGRGSINYQLKIRMPADLAVAQLDLDVLRNYVNQLEVLVTDGTIEKFDIGALLDLPGVYSYRDVDDEMRQRMWRVVQRLSVEAIDKLATMRQEEGRALAEDLLTHARGIRELAAAITERAPVVVTEYRNRLRGHVEQLLAEAQISINHDDLLREVSIFAERCDISEELTRLNCHLDQFEQLCRGNDHAGRKLDFLAQEMLREANTVGSKANDARIARHVVDIKGLIDRLKEQAQNVE